MKLVQFAEICIQYNFEIIKHEGVGVSDVLFHFILFTLLKIHVYIM